MKKTSIILIVILICFAFFFPNCKSCKSDVEKVKQDSLKAISNADSLKIATELKKYLITPPDPDYTGDYIDKYPNGVIKFTGFFRFGQRHGQWMAFYENGLKWSECFYDKGLKHGSTQVFYSNGNLNYSGWYKQDQKDSLWFWYDEKGKEVDKRAYRIGVETGLVN